MRSALRPRDLTRYAVLVACVATSASATQPVENPVAELRFDGASRISDAYMLNIIQTRTGVAYRREAIDRDVARLLQTGKFLTVTTSTEQRDGGVVVTFHLAERPVIQDIRFQGNLAIGDKALSEAVPVQVGDLVDAFAVREGRDGIMAAYRNKGFGYVAVDEDADRLRTTGELVYRIEEGPRVKVLTVGFEGNRSVDIRELRRHVRTKPALWVFRAGAFDPDQVSSDAVQIQNYYRAEGYLDARVSYRVDPGAAPGQLNVVFTIVEGEIYRIETIRVEGNVTMATDDILAEMRSATEQIVKKVRLDADVASLMEEYGERGHIYASVRAIRVYSNRPGYVLVTIQVNEGERISVGRIIVRGNETTQDKVVRRALDLYPGDTFNLSLTENAERRLRETQIFERASVTPIGSQPGVRDILVDVTEAESTNDFIFGFGVTSNSGLVGNILLNIKNFNIFDTPRSFSEFIRMRSFRGAGQRLRLELQPGTELSRFRIDFTEPYLMDLPIRFGTSIYHFTRSREDYNERRTGANVSIGKRFEEGFGSRQWFKDWYGEVALRAEEVDIDGADIFDDRSIRDVEGGTLLTSVKGTLVRDRTDNRFLPTKGDRFTLSYEQFIGDFTFGKLRASYTRHQTLYTDVRDRKSVLSFKVDAGLIGGTVPVFEKFYAGGIGSIRGFDFRGVGPRGGLRNNPIGGDFLLTLGTEYSFPLTGDLLRGVIFADMGTVERDFEINSWRAAVGVGIRLTIQLFGPVPIEIDFAIPISSDEDDDERTFSFFIGGVF